MTPEEKTLLVEHLYKVIEPWVDRSSGYPLVSRDEAWLCTRDFRKEAVKNGVAEWIANENGDAEFQWKTNSSAPSLKSSEEGK